MREPKVCLTFEHEDRVARVTLAAPRANILDAEMMGDLESVLEQLHRRSGLHAIVFSGEGPNFSFGASVEEHLPEKIGPTLRRLHELLRRMIDLPTATIAAVRGRCLGGGFELALACDLILAEENAQFGCPEIKLGVFPPAASAMLPIRIGSGPAASLVLTGESWTGVEAASRGLAARTAREGELEAELAAWLEKSFLPHSPVALRHAAWATRRGMTVALIGDLPFFESHYLEDLMAEPDAVEGIRAFLEKRRPRWGPRTEKGEAA